MSESVWIVEDTIAGETKRIGVYTSAEGADEAVTNYIAKFVKRQLSKEFDAENIATWEKISTGSIKRKLDFYDNIWFGSGVPLAAKQLTVERAALKD